MENPLISIIIPVYRAENYLQQCVDSVREQTYTNLEIILVDDGSPDKSGELCDAFALEDPRIRVIHKENGGQSSARNRALDVMLGEYVGFVDSDDWIETDMFETLYRNMEAYGAQISACGCQLRYSNGVIKYMNPSSSEVKGVRVFNMQEALNASMECKFFTFSLCDKLFHRNIFDNLRMTEGRIFEDEEIIPLCIERAETLVYTGTAYYYYRILEESTIHSKNFSQRMFIEADVALARANDYRTRHPEMYEKAYAHYINVCLGLIYSSRQAKDCKDQRKKLIRELREKLPINLSALTKNNRIKLRALRISPLVYTLLMKIKEWIKGS